MKSLKSTTCTAIFGDAKSFRRRMKFYPEPCIPVSSTFWSLDEQPSTLHFLRRYLGQVWLGEPSMRNKSHGRLQKFRLKFHSDLSFTSLTPTDSTELRLRYMRSTSHMSCSESETQWGSRCLNYRFSWKLDADSALKFIQITLPVWSNIIKNF